MAELTESTIGRRLAELVADGEKLLASLPDTYIVGVFDRTACLAWLLSVVNLLEIARLPDSRYRQEARRLLPKADHAITLEICANMLGILKSAESEWRNGLITTLEFHFVGMAFEDFLKHAAAYNEQGRKMEAAILASAVLEDTVKRLCRKNNIDSDGKGLDSLINARKNQTKVTKWRTGWNLRNTGSAPGNDAAPDTCLPTRPPSKAAS